MPQDRNKRKAAGEDNLIREERAKHRKIVVDPGDNYEDNTTSDVYMEDAPSFTNGTRPASSLSLGFTAGRLPLSHVSPSRTPQLDAAYDRDLMPQAELGSVGQQVEIAARGVEREVAMTSDPDGRIYHPTDDDAEPVPLMSLSNTVRNTSSSAVLIGSNPFTNLPTSSTGTVRLPALSTSSFNAATPVTSAKRRPSTDDARRKQLQVSSVGVIGYNEDTGSPVYLSSKSAPLRDTASRQDYAQKVADNFNAEDINRTLSRSKARRGKDTALTSKSTAKATKVPQAKQGIKTVSQSITEAAAAKQMPAKAHASVWARTSTLTASSSPPTEHVSPYVVRTTLAKPSTSTRPKNSNYTATPKLVTPEGTDKEDEARRKKQRREHRAQRQKELQQARRTWEEHKMPRNWGLITLPEDEV